MAYTNAQLARREAGDMGVVIRDLFSGNGSTLSFYLKGYPVLGGSYTVSVGGVTKTETADYSLDVETGRLLFVAAPAAGTDNIEIVYKSVELSDPDITELLRLRGLDGAATADVGPSSTLLLAAADIVDVRWSLWTSRYDVSMDGESLSRSQVAAALKDRWDALVQRARSISGINAVPVTIIDGYNRDLINSEEVLTTSRNPRRRFYGEEDRIP